MAASITDLLDRVSDNATGRPVVTSLAAPGKAIGATSITINDATNWTTTSAVHFVIYKTTTVAGTTVKDPTTQTEWKGTLTGTTISNLILTGGTDQVYNTNDIVELAPTARWAKDLYDNITGFANQDGSLKTSAVQTALSLGTGSLNGWNALGYTPATISYNGNRSYAASFNGIDLTGTLTPGMRLRFTRTTAGPTQCATFNGSTNYFSKASPAAINFTDDFGCGAWVKLTSQLTSTGVIASRYNGTSGWQFRINANHQVELFGFNAGSANYSGITSNFSLPMNRWVHVTAQLDMSSFTNTNATSFVMFDGTDVPSTVSRAGTNPTALIQAGNLEIGSTNSGTSLFKGQLASVAIYNAKLAQGNYGSYISQTINGVTTLNLSSAYSFNNSFTDLKTANANDLTPNGSASATTADSYSGFQSNRTFSTTLDYGIVTAVSYSTSTTTVTIQVPEGNTLPTSGSITAVAYSSQHAPYNMPVAKDRYSVITSLRGIRYSVTTTANTWVNPGSVQINVPTGEWQMKYEGSTLVNVSVAANFLNLRSTLSSVNNAETDAGFTASGTTSQTSVTENDPSVYHTGPLSVPGFATTYYLNLVSQATSPTLYLGSNDGSSFNITATCAYI